MTNKIWRLMLLCGLAASLAFAQAKVEGTLSGRVLLEDGQPAAGAKIQIYSVGTQRGGYEQSVQSDEVGNFKLTGLVSGSYVISALAPGYVTDERTENRIYRTGETATVRLVKGGVITGRVTDAAGELLIGVGVKIQRLRDSDGKSVRNGESSAWGDGTQTDDRGLYRAYGLQPGIYIASVRASTEWDWNAGAAEAPTYYPSTTRDAATEITVHAGEEVSSIDIRHRGDTGYAISGTVTGATESSQPYDSPGVTLLNAATKEAIAVTSVGGPSQSKGFVFFGVADGEYELYARMRGSKEDNGAGSPPRRVSVKGADATGIALRLAAYGSISGRFVIEPAKSGDAKCDSKSRPSVEEILLRPQSERRNPRSLNALLAECDEENERFIAPNEKGEFTMRGLEADSYRLEAVLPGEIWYVRGITQTAPQPAGSPAKKTDLSRSPINLKSGEKLGGIEITITEGAASLSGKVIAAKESRKLPSRLRVHLIPAEATATDDVLRYRETMAGKDGVFEFKQLAPGKYWLLARSVSENEANKEILQPAAFGPTERAQLRREAEAAKNEVELKPCSRMKDQALRF